MNFDQFSDVFNRIAALGGMTLVDGQSGTAEALFDQIREGGQQPGMPGGLVRQNAYQAFQHYRDAADAGKPGIGYRPKCNFHMTSQPIGQVSVTYI